MSHPRRVVSLVPSLTELVFFLGRGDALVGRTRFCDEPVAEVGRVPIVGGTKNPAVGRVVALSPDLVIVNKEENRREDVEALQAAGLDVLLTEPNTVSEALSMIAELGRILDATPAASALVAETHAALAEPPAGPVRVLVPIWWKPLMALGSGTYGHDLLEATGAVNVLHGRPRYPEISLDEARDLAPDLILLPNEPFPFKPTHAAELSSIAPARIIDGRLLWWYGPRMPSSIRSLRRVLLEARSRV